jgi:hypothetical protein
MGNLSNRYGNRDAWGKSFRGDGPPAVEKKVAKGLHDDAPKKHVTKGPGDSPLQEQLKKARAAHAEAEAKPVPRGIGVTKKVVTKNTKAVTENASGVTENQSASRGRPKKAGALSPAEKQRAYRERKAKGGD